MVLRLHHRTDRKTVVEVRLGGSFVFPTLENVNGLLQGPEKYNERCHRCNQFLTFPATFSLSCGGFFANRAE